MPRLARGEPRIFGVAAAIVTHNQDPQEKGRIRIRYPWLREENESGWARIALPYAGDGRGLYLLPEVGDEVVVAFEEGDPDRPVVVGSLWSGRDTPPCRPAEGNGLKWFESRRGLKVICDDTEGSERILIRDGEEKRSVEIDMAGGAIRIRAEEGDVEIAAPAGRLSLQCQELSLACSGKAGAAVDGDVTVESKGGIAVTGKREIRTESQGRFSQSGRFLELCGAAALRLRGNQVEIRGDAAIRQRAPMVQIN